MLLGLVKSFQSANELSDLVLACPRWDDGLETGTIGPTSGEEDLVQLKALRVEARSADEVMLICADSSQLRRKLPSLSPRWTSLRREGQSVGLGGTTRRVAGVETKNRSLQAAETSEVMNKTLSGAGVMLIAGMRNPMGLCDSMLC
jgi:hypothetical protein